MTQITLSNNSQPLIRFREDAPDTLTFWMEAYFKIEVTTSDRSQKEQKRDLSQFISFVLEEEGDDLRLHWSPRMSRDFIARLRAEKKDGKRRYSDRTVNRIIAHLKTWAKWIYTFIRELEGAAAGMTLRNFPWGNPMAKIKSLPVGNSLEVERALTNSERRKLLDAADLLPEIAGRSKDRSRYKAREKPRRKTYRAFRNRAVIYTLIETGMRRAAVTQIDLADVDFVKSTVYVREKGGAVHGYTISREGLAAIEDYLHSERPGDNRKWQSEALFLTAASVPHGDGRMKPPAINEIWKSVCSLAGVEGKTPHSARHAMGKYLIEKTGNIAAVQRQLGHKNAAYSMQYARITSDELIDVLNKR